MDTIETERSLGVYGKSELKSPILDFYSRLTELTRGISQAQLDILRDHVASIKVDRQGLKVAKRDVVLSSRETEVLILVTNGYSRRDIGRALDISINTAARHIANIYQKLGISCVAEATHYALLHNIVGINSKPKG